MMTLNAVGDNGGGCCNVAGAMHASRAAVTSLSRSAVSCLRSLLPVSSLSL